MSNVYKHRHILAFMKCAENFADLSHAKRLQVGAVLIRGDQILAQGWNGTLPGEPNCCETPDGSATLPSVRHAEVNCLNKLRHSSETSVGGIMIVTHQPCPRCSEELIQAKVHGVVYRHPYRDQSGIDKLISLGKTIYQIQPDDTIMRHHNTGGLVYYDSETLLF